MNADINFITNLQFMRVMQQDNLQQIDNLELAFDKQTINYQNIWSLQTRREQLIKKLAPESCIAAPFLTSTQLP